MTSNYINLLNEKYGSKIVSLMTEIDDFVRIRKGNADDIYVRNLFENNKEVVRNILNTDDKNIDNIINANDWVFDFPGWVGDLNFNKLPVKEVMVIGMEPHIGYDKKGKVQSRNFQATYGLRETGTNEFKELDEYKSNINLWKNLNSMIGDGKDYHRKDFLERFYLTDMSHFAVQGDVKKTYDLKGWNKLRLAVAKRFLIDEIEIIKPKLIVAQGGQVSNFIRKIFERTGERSAYMPAHEFNIESPYKNYPSLKKYEYNGRTIDLLKVPHLSSPMTNNAFWNKGFGQRVGKALSQF